jgi:glycosyltransferase involved in cell wall biosynthesis
MNKIKPILSICIPTYNREDDLKNCIDAIFKLHEKYLKKIEVCVSDNFSHYDFVTMISNLNYNKKIIFSRNNKNIGFDKNVINVIKMATGKYVMLLGDDDTINYEEFYNIIYELENNDPDAVFSNYRVVTKNNTQFYFAYNIKKNVTNTNFNWIIHNLKEKSGFLSSMILKRDICDLDSVAMKNFIGGQFIHMAIAFDSLKISKRVMYFADPLVIATDKNVDTYNVKDVFLINLGSIINYYSQFYEKNSIKKLKFSILRHVLFSKEIIFFHDLLEYKFINTKSLFMYFLSITRFINFIYILKEFVKLCRKYYVNSGK